MREEKLEEYRACLELHINYSQKKHPSTECFQIAWQRPTLTGGIPQLPSAQKSLTTVFGMGTGVTSLLSPPSLRPEYASLLACDEQAQEQTGLTFEFLRQLRGLRSCHVCLYAPFLSHLLPRTSRFSLF